MQAYIRVNGKIVKELVSTDSFSFNYIVSYIKSTSNSGSGGERGSVLPAELLFSRLIL